MKKIFALVISVLFALNVFSQAVFGGFLENVELGENITAPAMVYVSSSDGNVYKATATDLTKGAQGALLVSGSTGDSRQIHYGSCTIEWPSPLTAGSTLYLSNTAGAITTTAPTNKQNIGVVTPNGLLQLSIAPFSSAGGASYLVYTALITQSAFDAPTVLVLENTIGTIEWTYSDIGKYNGSLVDDSLLKTAIEIRVYP